MGLGRVSGSSTKKRAQNGRAQGWGLVSNVRIRVHWGHCRQSRIEKQPLCSSFGVEIHFYRTAGAQIKGWIRPNISFEA